MSQEYSLFTQSLRKIMGMEQILQDILEMHSVSGIHQRALSYFLSPENPDDEEEVENKNDTAFIYQILCLQSYHAIHKLIRIHLNYTTDHHT